MNADDRSDFDAFISYSHADKADALRIQRFLESFPLPAKPGTPRRRLRVFRDDTDIRAAELSGELATALARSRALIVCCSPQAVRSKWVHQELDVFLEKDRSRPVLPIIVAGDPSSALPGRIAAAGYRHVDARRAWRFGILRTTARDELVRVVAALAGEDLRTFIPWDRRRRRALAAGAAAALAPVLAGVLFLPFDYSRALGRPSTVSSDGTIEFCDVVDDRLVLAARETYGRGTIETPSYADYVHVYPDVLGHPEKRAWLDQSGYLPAGRLLHVSTSARIRDLASGIDLTPLRRLALQHVSLPDAAGTEELLQKQALEPGFWAGTPAPDVKIVLVALRPAAFDPYALNAPASGAAVIAIKDGAALPHISLVQGLSPPSLGARPPSSRAARLAETLSVAVTPREIFIGMPMREDGGAGGLWRWDRNGKFWAPVKFRTQAGIDHANVSSIVSDTRHPGRVLVSTAPGKWFWNERKGEYAAEVYQRPSYDASRRVDSALSTRPLSSSPVQLCGFKRDSTLYARVDQSLVASGPHNLLRMLLGRD